MNDVKRTVDALSSAGLVICGRLFESDSESVTVDADGAHYDVLLEYVTNAAELANVKRGETVEVRVSPDAKIVEKRLIRPMLPGIITGSIFSTDDYVERDDTDCSYCNCSHDCSYCSQCITYCTYPPRNNFAQPQGWSRRFVQR